MKFFRIVILTVITTLLIFAQGSIKKPFLWKVSKGEGQFYLFGTMHLAEPELQILPEELIKIINSSDRIYLEVAMDVATQLKASAMALRSDKKRLQDILPPKLYHDCDAYIRKLSPHMRLDFFDKMKIWAVSSTITTLKSHLKYPNLRPIDKIIYDYARSHKIDIRGVEKIEEQLGIMDGFTEEEQIISLDASLKELEEKEDSIAQLKAYYLKGESDPLLKFMESSMFQLPQYTKLEERFMQALLYDRNVRMAKRIDTIVKYQPQKQYLFAFGVMHFLGMKSVIGYLKTYGYRVERLK